MGLKLWGSRYNRFNKVRLRADRINVGVKFGNSNYLRRQKEVMFSVRSVCLSVCLFVCLSVRRITRKLVNGF